MTATAKTAKTDRVDYRQIVEARLSGDLGALNDLVLRRLLYRAMEDDQTSLAILTSQRADLSGQENLSRHRRLEHDIRSAGLGLFRLRCYWSRCRDVSVPIQGCPERLVLDTSEPAFGVVGISKPVASRLAAKYDSTAFLYLGPETSGRPTLVFQDGTEEDIGEFETRRIARAYSGARGRLFRFRGFDLPPQTWSQALVDQAVMREARNAPS